MNNRNIHQKELDQIRQKFTGWLVNFQNCNKLEIKIFLPWTCNLLQTNFKLETLAPQDRMILASLILEFELELRKTNEEEFGFMGQKASLLAEVIKKYLKTNNIFLPLSRSADMSLLKQFSNPDCASMSYIKIADAYFEKYQRMKHVSLEAYFQIQLSKDLTALRNFDEQTDPNLIPEFERILARINSYFSELPLSKEEELIDEISNYQLKKQRHPTTILETIQRKTTNLLASLNNDSSAPAKAKKQVLENLLRLIIERNIDHFSELFKASLPSLAKINRSCMCTFFKSPNESYAEEVNQLLLQYSSNLVRGNTISF